MTDRITTPQVDCPITRTTDGNPSRSSRRTCHRSAMYSGRIESRGPRYCPSIEDKVVRFAGSRRRIRYSWSPKASTITRSIPTASRRRSPKISRSAGRPNNSRTRTKPYPAPGLCDRVRPCRPSRARTDAPDASGSPDSSLQARSTERRVTRRPQRRAFSPGSMRPGWPAAAGRSSVDRSEGLYRRDGR